MSRTFHVDCPCGRAHPVAEGAAGVTLRCDCGWPVEVPALDELRRRAGLPAYALSPELLIEHALQAGELPPDDRCAGCAARTADTVRVRAECERRWTANEGARFAWLGLLFGIGGYLLARAAAQERDPRQYGRDKVYDLPLPVCPGCRPRLGRPRELRRALGQVPLYDRLLEKFPNARLTLLPAGPPTP